MKIQLVSFDTSKKYDKIKAVSEVFNTSSADLILFSGWSLNSFNDLDLLQAMLTNTKSIAIIETKKGRRLPFATLNNELFLIKEAKIYPLYTFQQFKDSTEINNDKSLAASLIHEMSANRIISVFGRRMLILQCGEINILKNIQKDNNRVEFRYADDLYLKNIFESIISNVEIILNPIHTPMGNQGKMHQRRKFFSIDSRYYFSVANAPDGNFDAKSIFYSYYNGDVLVDGEKENISSAHSYSQIFKL